MITKMKFLTISGPKDDIDRMVDQYLSHHEIHLENALTELYGAKTLRPYTSSSPFKDYLERINTLLDYLGAKDSEPPLTKDKTSLETIRHLIEQLEQDTDPYHQKVLQYTSLRDKEQESLNLIAPFVNLDYPIEKIVHMENIRFRFGRFTRSNYNKFTKYVYDITPSIFIECVQDENYTYGVYFTPLKSLARVDAMFASMNWERIFIPDEYEGTPQEIVLQLRSELKVLNKHISDNERIIKTLLTPYKNALLKTKQRLENLAHNFNIRKYAALTHDEFVQKETRYLLRGWMTEKAAIEFEQETEGDPNVIVIVEDEEDTQEVTPPTKIHNFSFFRPYELFVKMYGVPNYREFDPTSLVALTYSLLFGAMFGDVGQGSILAVGGFLLYKLKDIDLGGIVALAGVFSTIFGFLYGSLFGFEDIIEPLWLHPLTAMTDLPFIGMINTVFVAAIAFGMFMITTTLVLSVVIKWKNHQNVRALFDRNGLAGLVFYLSLITVVLVFLSGNPIPATLILLVMFGLPLLLIAFEEPIINKLEHHKAESDSGMVMFIVQAFFELFEVLLSYFSNTISFVRVGAFAVSHAAMMQVVLMLAGAVEGGDINWLVIIMGNIFVAGLEGLVVGIQVLRLEFYEIFSHFYKGDGKPFISILR
ncbi:V/A-type H+-transporting ATPase subunit I [Alkalibacterium putridalgicola]|uniref:V-type ATP synthase subunit I n=1 Tax=Alkalibacterium putridalgicola TaxID=426703 RepID=A0A1H7TMH2_9LACT|nr:V-type ATPase 116kDa subunit family protein [Alkalibacterium putridalgicola]GEK88215.1 V-type ATP synthase subunit I [Alkalibacterium putridalgicola]SEL85689.1 V/A-type H+-transporting ATPase subunit I [Alkalibacterium putridalgicola]